MSEHHIISRHCHLVVAVVVGVVGKERESVALIHLHIAESLEGV